MTERDKIQRFIFVDGPVRGEMVHLDATWRAVLERHPYPEPIRNLLGQMMVSAVLLSATLKYDGRMIMQIHGNGPVKLLVVECTSDRTLRGLAQWEGDLSAPDVPLLDAKNGRLVITVDPAHSHQRYQSVVPLEGATIARALEAYLQRSEQIETRLWVTSDAETAAGMLIQKLPGQSSDDDIWDRAVQIANTVGDHELLTLPFEDLLYRLYHDEDVTLFDAEPVSFRCTCSRDRVANMLRSLGRQEVTEILAEVGRVSVHCEFCNRAYDFDHIDAEAVFGAPAPDISSSRH